MRPKKTILCIDDNEQSLSIRKFMLETRGYRVLTSNTGHEALDLFRQSAVDLVLSDFVMPGMSGEELIRHVKEVSPDTPAILFSGKLKAHNGGTHADVFLPKGTHEPAELLERIRLLLVRKRGPKKGGSQRLAISDQPAEQRLAG